MTNPIDIGSGINALELLGDAWGNSKQTLAPQPPPATTNDFKTTFLAIQKAIIDKDIAVFKSGLQRIQSVLNNKQINTLGREILRNFDQRFVDALTNCPWDDLITADTAMAQVSRENIEGFSFCINILDQRDSDGGQLKRYYSTTEMREIFARLSYVTANNYQTYDTCRLLVAPLLKSPYKEYAIEDALEQVYSITPQNLMAHQGLMDCLAQMDVNWSEVFGSKHPFKVHKQKELFGASAFFHRHYQIFEKYNTWAHEQKVKYEQFCAFCEKRIFKVSNDTEGYLDSILSSDFKNHIGDDLHRWNAELTPNDILSAFKNGSYFLAQEFKDEIRKFAKNEDPNLGTYFHHIVGSELLFERDPNFIISVLKTPNGVENIQQYAVFPPHLKIIANQLWNANFAHQKKMLKDLESITDANGNTISHLFAHKLATQNLKDPAVQKLVLLCMKTNWSKTNAAGETPSTLFTPPSQEMRNIAQEVFNKHLNSHLNNTVTQHLKDNKVKPQKTTKRKI